MRSSVFTICVLIAVALISLGFILPVNRSDHQDDKLSAKSSNLRETLSKKDFDKPADTQVKLDKRTQPSSELPDGLAEEFEQYHLQTVNRFGQAMGFGRTRGGAHVLQLDGAVKFVEDNITETRNSKSSYGLWGKLGAGSQTLRNDAANEDVGDAQAIEAISANESVDAPEDATLEPPPTIKARANYHADLTETGFERFAPSANTGQAYPFVLQSLDLLSTDMGVGYTTQASETIPELLISTKRPLDPFESEALPRLAAGSHAEFLREGHQLQVVAAIRSGEHCNDCHRKDTGDLLGAFHYRMTMK